MGGIAAAVALRAAFDDRIVDGMNLGAPTLAEGVAIVLPSVRASGSRSS
ncbi:MAG: hypothetical protein OXG37_09510 [Actinomycetia bacterium]|nr:hypothetical protein [Actinomycetes bacterium]